MNIKIVSRQMLKTSVMCACITSALISFNANAQLLIPKPGPITTNTEFGSAIAQYENITVTGTTQDRILLAGELPVDTQGNDNREQGSVYVFENANPTPKVVYQFPGAVNRFRGLGSRVAISNKWLAFVELKRRDNSLPAKAYIVGKDNNNQWRTCLPANSPANTLVDCTQYVAANGGQNNNPVLKSIDLPFSSSGLEKNALTQNIAISDNYLVLANADASMATVYRYDSNQNKWIQEWTFDGPDDMKFGAAIAIEGDRLAISAPGHLSGRGAFFTLKRNSSLQTWDWTGGWISDINIKNFGQALDMRANRIVAGGNAGTSDNPSGTLSFYNFDTGGNLYFQQMLTTQYEPKNAALYENTAAAAFDSRNFIAGKTYKLNPALNQWQEFETIPQSIVPADVAGLLFSTREIELYKNTLVMGWMTYHLPIANSGLVGALVLKDFVPSTNCKSVSNLVPNCSFDIPTATNWSLTAYNGANAWVNYSGNQMLNTINNAGSEFWHVQARTAVNLTVGTYTLRFNAKAASARAIQVNLGHYGGSWQSYAQKTVNLTSTMQTFTLTLTNIPTDINSVLDFNLGKTGTSAVTLDEVSLVKNP
ncbi:MAG: carbohydrate binding domain-containing protein [Pseudomonadota bacterium]